MHETALFEPLGELSREFVRLLSGTPGLVPLLALFLVVWAFCRPARRGDGPNARRVALGLLLLGLSDGALVWALPRLGLSFGPLGLPWLGMILLRAGLVWSGVIFARRAAQRERGRIMALVWALNLAILACEVYGLYFEPFNLGVSRVHVSLPGAPNSGPLTVVQLSDWHIERITRREREALAEVERLNPDLILLTGDYLNLSYVDDARARQDARDVLAQLDAPQGVYAIPGTPVVDTSAALASIFDGLDNVRLLSDELAPLEVEGQTIYLVGVANLALERDRQSLEELMRQVPAEAGSILLYHTPDLVETAAELGVDLYLAGHTHGGQVRLPWFGAILTASKYGKRYEAGLYQVGATQLYVSRGLGMEGLGAPRVRFLCPPEIVVLELSR
jgi:hypothetical protein